MATSDIPGELEQTRRRQAGGLPVGIGLSPEQLQAQRRQVGQQRMAETLTNTRASAGQVLDRLGNSAANVAKMPVQIAVEGTKQIGGALGNATFDDSLPDHTTPIQRAEKQRNDQRRAAGWVEQNPERAAQAKSQMQSMADRAVGVAQIPFTNDIARGLLTNTLRKGDPAAVAPAGGPSTAAPAATAGKPASAAAAQDAGTPQDAGLNGWNRTGIGEGRAGGEIVGRMGANGVPEFSNLADDVKGAGSQRATGSVGDGIGGGLTTIQAFKGAAPAPGYPGGMVRGGGLTIVGADGPDNMEIAAERRRLDIAGLGPRSSQRAIQEMEDQRLTAKGLGLRGREIAATEAKQAQDAGDAAADRALRERELAGAEQRNQLEGQRIQQEIEAGNLTLAQQRRVEDLSARIADPATDDTERESMLRTYSQLTGKTLDSGTVKLKRVGVDPTTGEKTEEEYLADARTGQPVAQGGGKAGAVLAGYKDGKPVYRDASGKHFIDD